MGLTLKAKTNKPAALKMMSAIASFLFEQEYGELRGHENVKQKLKEAQKALSGIV